MLLHSVRFIFPVSFYFRDICDLADKHNALVFLDDAHATGLFGKSGR